MMRDVFGEFYAPTTEEEARFATGAHIVLDTNILLDLYRFNADRRESVLAVLDQVQDRLWIPYQVGLEYQRNRLDVISAQVGAYASLLNLPAVRDEVGLRARLEGLNLPDNVKDAARSLLSDLARNLQEATVAFRRAATALRDQHIVTPDIAADPVRDRLDTFFTGRVGQRPCDQEHEKAVAEGLNRIENEVPPGFADNDKATDERKVGDYLVWSQMLAHATSVRDDGLPFLFVTNDVKKDWYRTADKEPVGPLPELSREFAAANPNGYHQVTLDKFLELANEHLDAHVPRETIDTATELRRASADEATEVLSRGLDIESRSLDEDSVGARTWRRLVDDRDYSVTAVNSPDGNRFWRLSPILPARGPGEPAARRAHADVLSLMQQHAGVPLESLVRQLSPDMQGQIRNDLIGRLRPADEATLAQLKSMDLIGLLSLRDLAKSDQGRADIRDVLGLNLEVPAS